MDYVFVFVGEFGVELLNWQGAVRKLSDALPPEDRVVCCSRASLYPLYECADAYVEISSVPSFQHSRAMAYFALPDAASSWDSLAARRFNEHLKRDLEAHIRARLAAADFHLGAGGGVRFVFSSDNNEIDGLRFGRRRHGRAGALLITAYEQVKRAAPRRLGAVEQMKRAVLGTFRSLDRNTDANIYELLDTANNRFTRISPDPAVIPTVAQRLGWDLREPFVLCQTRRRDTMQRSPDTLPASSVQRLLKRLAEDIRIVLLSFETGRWLDSYSAFAGLPNCTTYQCGAFPEQAALVAHARHCLFFSEGDFGSHTYVPPFMGRDVTAIAPASVYRLGTTPIDFWNQNVFTFGGQIEALAAEKVLADDASIDRLAAAMLAKAKGAPDFSAPGPLFTPIPLRGLQAL